jgi:hypothetical protein
MTAASADVEQWDLFELALKGPGGGNPFLEVELSARFEMDDQSIETRGFYDGEGTYRIRFSPPQPGRWRFETSSNRSELTGRIGNFHCTPATGNNHGPVRVRNTFHFAYADGTPYRQVGTTCYAWTHQGDELEELTLRTLKSAPFNKLRMCIFPKHYSFNQNEPLF